MPNVTINDTLAKPELEGSDFIPIWDSTAGEQKKILPTAINSALGVFHPGYISNRWYLSAYALEDPGTDQKGVNSGVIYYGLLPIYRSANFSEIGIVVTNAGSLARLGIHKMNHASVVGDLIGEAEVDVSVAGFRSVALSLNLEPGLYATAIFGESSFAVSSYTQSNSVYLIGSSAPRSNLGFNLSSHFILSGQTYGNLPNPANASRLGGGGIQAVWLKAA